MKKLLSYLLVFALCLALAGCGVTAAAADTESVKASVSAAAEEDPQPGITITFDGESISADGSSGVVVSGSTVTITREGTYRLTGTLTDGQVIVNADNAKVVLLLSDADIACAGSAAVYVQEADKVTLFLAEGSENALASTGTFTDPEGEIDAAVFSKDDLVIRGSGSLTVKSETGHGIVSKDDLKIKNGTLTVTAAKKGLSGNDSVEIEGGAVTVDSGKDAIHAENSDDASLGNVLISGGSVTVKSGSDGVDASGGVTVEGGSLDISADDDGIHADGAFSVTGGSILIRKSYEGLEAKVIDISGGNIDLTASDDGLNATGGSAASGWGRGGDMAAQAGVVIRISGGSVTVNAGGDGIDSNGDLEITGGEIYVSGPTNSGNGALDTNGTAVISGGTVVAAGAAGMAETFGSGSAQGSILYTFPSVQSSGTAVTLKDSSGNVLATFAPEKSFQTVVISAPGMAAGGTYTLSCGSVSESITLNSAVWTNGVGMMGGPMGQQPGGMGGMGGFGGPQGGGFGPGRQ